VGTGGSGLIAGRGGGGRLVEFGRMLGWDGKWNVFGNCVLAEIGRDGSRSLEIGRDWVELS